ncbi:MAG: Gfo/Idh/MocA family oxidoreductase [Deltaproteobacteria bacterium]|nr:Gfo/Idh/MocA family oxidoreductase [Deltaproteobacteria bacterium]
MNSFKAVQIGCGGRAQTHARAIAQVERLDFVATCDLVEEKAKKTADANGVPRTYTDFRQMMETEQPDVVAFVAPPVVRSQVVLPVLEYQPKALVIEKPMAISLEEAEAMVNKADEVGTCFAISHQCRYSEEMVKLRELIQSGRLGKIEKIIVNCKLNLMGQGTHILDLIQMVYPGQEPRWVMAQIDGVSQLYASGGGAHPTFDHSVLQIGYDGGVTAFASIGNRSPDVPENINNVSLQFQVSAIGSDGYGEATLAYGLDAFLSEDSAERSRFPGFDTNAQMTQALYEEVVDVLEGVKDEHQASAHGALRVQRLINAAYESSLQGRAIRLPYRPLPGTLARVRHRVAANRPVVASTLMYGRYSREETLREISAYFQHVDVWMLPGMASHFDPEAEDVSVIKTELQSLGLSVPMISYYGRAPVEAKLRVAHALGAKVAVTGGVNVKKSPNVAEALKPHLDLAQQLGIKIAFENHTNSLETIEDMRALLETLNHPAASICLAPTHLEFCGQHTEDALAALKDRVSVLYLWDMNVYTPEDNQGKHWRDGDAQTPGTSNLDFRSILTAAIRYAPLALWSFTWHGTEDWPIERITSGLIRASRHIDRCRPLNPDSVFWK